jgi:hypothetical protein
MQPAPPPAPPAPAAAPAAPAAAPRLLVNGTSVEIPRSALEVKALRERRDMLSSQLGSVKDRRDETAEEMRNAVPGQDFLGLEQRLKVLDARMLNIENDIAQTSAAIAAAPPSILSAGSEEPSAPAVPLSAADRLLDEDVIVPVVSVLSIFVFFPIAIAKARSIWRRPAPVAPTSMSPDLQQRLDRMEQSIDSIAIEVERVSEGQRFVTQLMSEPKAIGAGAAPRFEARAGEAVPVAQGIGRS